MLPTLKPRAWDKAVGKVARIAERTTLVEQFSGLTRCAVRHCRKLSDKLWTKRKALHELRLEARGGEP